MEFFAGLILVIVAIASLIFFKGTIKKSASYVENAVGTNINEANVDFTKRSMEAYQDLIDECGEDFMTPDEVFNKMNKRSRRKKTN